MNRKLIQKKIYTVRGQRVMLDFDLAFLYGVETKVLNQAVKRNASRFPSDFMFKLKKSEWDFLRSQIVTLESEDGRGKFSKYLPYAFTEYGISMLASVLKSEQAIKMNIAIVRAFISLRKFSIGYTKLAEQIRLLKKTAGNHDKKIKVIYLALERLLAEAERKKKWEGRELIGFKIKKNE